MSNWAHLFEYISENPGRDSEDWKTPEWFKIKNEKSRRTQNGPYSNFQIWQPDEVLSILKYERNLRNKAIITMMWDLNARNHEITALQIRHISFKDKYADGEIPRDTKTEGGPIMLTMSFPYARDWLNQQPRKNDGTAPFICKQDGTRINPDAIYGVMQRLRLRSLVKKGNLYR
jgi:integrase/recombinase XerD